MLRVKDKNIKRVIVDKQSVNFRTSIRFTVNGKEVKQKVGHKALNKLVEGKKI